MTNSSSMNSWVFGFQDIDKTNLALVGGKGANLGELTRIEGIQVPDGFCISTEAFKRILGETPSVNELLDQLSLLQAADRDKISALSGKIRRAIEGMAIPPDIQAAITHYLTRFDEQAAFAVRSSATAEDLPTASFAGQQDTYLNIIGKQAILQHIRKCWASLFTDRAVVYRIQNGFDHRKVYLSVVVQQMVFPQAAGIVFTADPLTGNRKVLSIDASFGLGEALVAGLVNADNYKVRDGKLSDKKVSAKKLAIYALQEGGTQEQEIGAEQQMGQALTDEQVLQLEHIGRKIETHFGQPQDIEWCLANGDFYIVQSRPITTLFPTPPVHDEENHVYLSVGHQQMMTDAMKPLGLSCWLLLTPATMRVAGGRLFVDITPMLANRVNQQSIIDTLGKFDPLIKDALMTVIGREGFINMLPPDKDRDDKTTPGGGKSKDAPPVAYQTLQDYDPAIVANLVHGSEAAIAELKLAIQAISGPALFDLIREDIGALKQRIQDPQSMGVIFSGMNAASWINEKMKEWLGETNAADTIAQSVPNNVTSEMGLALLDVGDVIRPYPAIIAYLQQVALESGSPEVRKSERKMPFLQAQGGNEDSFLDELLKFKGGQEVRKVIDAFLHKYGMRCAGEIDITRTRWSEKPGTLVPLILSNIKNLEPGASKRKFEQGLEEASKKEQDLLARLKQLPDGEEKARETKRMIGLVRSLSGYREYPKYSIVSRYFIYKQALMKEADQLVQAGMLEAKEDVHYLSFDEFRDVVSTHTVDQQVISERKAAYTIYEKLTPPRVITSDGEIVTGAYKREDLPADAIPGLAVSSGVIEGRARVILNMEAANIADGDILVTPFTDPSWTPLFVSIKGLVTEVGGLMTHGAVIAREYGLPAVVGVEHATRLIKDGQRIRVNGTDGYVEIL